MEVLARILLLGNREECEMSIFDAFASSYIREDANWGCDLDILKDALRDKTDMRARYLDLGCGPGFHVGALALLHPEVDVTGADSSATMLEKARSTLERLRVRNVRLIHADITESPIQGTYDVVSCLNNTLNNLYEPDACPIELRKKMVGRMRSLLEKDGCLVLSVYNREKLNLRKYGKNFSILPESDVRRGDLFIEYRPSTDIVERCYSHWSTDIELIALLEQSGFEIELLEKRMARLVVKARAT